ncbi:hypothetical protein [Absidia glauca]|uniref:Uncharacterized protein n=1 Tax=Absidia glauca TaxID=4829 RepID=A0A163JTL7_ABSGL|nr:hypothetical protein [Absidia glauca]
MSQSTWPQCEDDPFKQVNTQGSPPMCIHEEQEEIAPKWLLQTDEELMDQQQAVRAMESKLRRIKENPTTQYQARMENDINNSNDEEEDDDDDDDDDYYQGDQEVDECLGTMILHLPPDAWRKMMALQKPSDTIHRLHAITAIDMTCPKL